MAKQVLTIFLLFGLGSLLVTCDNHEFPGAPYPRVETLSVINISASGVRLRGNIIDLGNSPVIEHGFVWGFDKGITVGGSEGIIKLEADASSGEFRADVVSGLFKGQTYYVKAFVRTADHLVYGQSIKFKSNGSNPPAIESFEPALGTWGDTVILHGSYFGTTPRSNLVKFNELPAKVISATESTIICIVPDNLDALLVPISVEVTDNLTEAENKFQLTVPVINGFSPATGTFQDEVVITGSNFGTNPVKHLVTFGNHTAQVIAAAKTSLTVKVPSEVDLKNNVIKLTYNMQVATADGTFTMLAPIITSLSKTEGLIGDELELTGENFSPRLLGNEVQVGGNKVTVISATAHSLRIKIPAGIYPQRISAVTMTVAEQTATSTSPFKLLNAWLQKGYTPAADFDGGSFEINNTGYFLAGSYTYSYNSSTSTWTRKADFPGGPRFSPVTFAAGGLGYSGSGEGWNPGGYRPDFWSYAPASDSWTQLNDLLQEYGLAFSTGLGNKGYGVGGFVTVDMTAYDPANDSWGKVGEELNANFTGYPHFVHAIFTMDTRLFVYLKHQYDEVNSYLYEFDLGTGKWIRRADTPEYMNGGFSINGTGYISGYKFMHEYNLATNVVTLKAIPMPDNQGVLDHVFTVDDKAYFTGPWANGHYEFWEFDPAYK